MKGASTVALRTKGQAIGSAVLSTVVASAVASTPTSISPQGLQEAQEAGFAAGGLTQATLAAIGNNVKQADGQLRSIESYRVSFGGFYLVELHLGPLPFSLCGSVWKLRQGNQKMMARDRNRKADYGQKEAWFQQN